MHVDIKFTLILQKTASVQVQTGRRFAWLLSKLEVCDTYFEKWINVSLFIKKYKLVINTLENKNLLPKKDWGIQNDLIEELDRLYPDKIEPTSETEVKDIFYRAGQVSVVRKLKQMHMDKKELQNNA